MAERRWHEGAWYVIRVRGILGPGGCTWFGGLMITHDSAGNTVLSGEVVDRSAFYGLMSRARDLGLAVLSVERREYSEEYLPGKGAGGPSAGVERGKKGDLGTR